MELPAEAHAVRESARVKTQQYSLQETADPAEEVKWFIHSFNVQKAPNCMRESN